MATPMEPCPFCGEFMQYVCNPRYDSDESAFVQCQNCSASGPPSFGKDPVFRSSHAIRLWNYRPSSKRPVAWRCKDYADGWIIFQDREKAVAYQAETGCVMQPMIVD